MTDCPLKEPSHSNPPGINNDVLPAALPVQGTVTFSINCGGTATQHQSAWRPKVQTRKRADTTFRHDRYLVRRIHSFIECKSKIASLHALSLLPYDLELYAANGESINTLGVAENVSFQLGGHTLKTNFVVNTDHIDYDYFLLGRNFFRTYYLLVGLTTIRRTIRDPKNLHSSKQYTRLVTK